MRVLVICDGATPKAKFSPSTWDEQIQVNHLGSNSDLNLRIENISHAVLKDVGQRASDLVRIASYIYAADQLIRRGGPTDMYHKHWKRDFSFAIPVQDMGFWNQNIVQEKLADVLSFVTEDNYSFEFTQLSDPSMQLVFDFEKKESLYSNPDCAVLFSGGADSLCAVVELVGKLNRKPLLISHTPSPIHDAIQERLTGLLRGKFPAWAFPHVSIHVNRKGSEARESSQRSRSFLYLTLGSVVANQIGLKDVFLPDNGIVTLNLPKSPEVIGAFASRSTHPRFIEKFQHFFDLAFPGIVRISNPLLYLTRAKALTILKENHSEPMLQETISCASMRGRSKESPHCGTCSQCVDRRFGSLAAGLQQYDLVEKYGKDIFTDELREGDQRTLAESYVRFALDIDKLSDSEIFLQYPQLYECINADDSDPDRTATKLVQLLKHHSSEVLQVVRDQLNSHTPELLNGELPESCLIKLLASGDHLKDPKYSYATRLGEMLKEGITKAFQSQKPSNEHHVQDFTEALLLAAKADLDREVPLLPFAGISTKPDFSKHESGNFKDWLFVEMKYVKTKTRVNGIITELTSRIYIYQEQDAYALFCIYDPYGYLKTNKVIEGLMKDSQKFQVVIVN